MDGVQWRSWSAADRVSAGYLILLNTMEPAGLRQLHELMGDKEAIARLDRETMGQGSTLQLDNPPGR